MELEHNVDLDTDSDEESEAELHDLEQLTAVLQADDDIRSETTSRHFSSIDNKTVSSTKSTLEIENRIDNALSLNKMYNEKLWRLERILTGRLKEVRQKITEIQFSSANLTEKTEVFRYINCGRPYFRDKLNFPAPDNSDAVIAKSQMYDFSLVISVPGWTVRDKSQFITQIHKMSIDLKKDELRSKIAELKRKSKNKNSKKLAKEIEAVQKELDKVAKAPFSQLALPIDKEYDWDTLANKLNKRHTAQEYQALWKLFFHPTINKNSWSQSEHSSLQTIASANKQQDWDNIAKQLKSGRTGYQCFVYYRTNMSNTFTGKKWTNEEITYLKRLIEYFREDNYIPWGKIAAAMENRTKIQIYNKYLRLIEQRKGRFLQEEDAVILNCVERFGTNFRRMTTYLPGRSMLQIRARYAVLNKIRISTVWTVDDDRKLIQIMTNQDMNFSNATKFFPGRNRANIRSRYVTLLRWMKKHPNMDIEHAPRRGARRLNHGQASDDLNKAIENLKNTLNTEVETRSTKNRVCKDSCERDIEDAIIAALVTECVKENEAKKTAESQTLQNTTNMEQCDYLNISNLRRCLIFLSSNLDKNLYEKSMYQEMYPDLEHEWKEVALVKVKSYSRKEKIKTITVDGIPDIWGQNVLSQRNYVFPPHYATITGCKVLLAHVRASAQYCDNLNIHVIVRRNSILKEQYDLLLERFYTLFLWPMLLSNEGPSEFSNMKSVRIDSTFIRPPALPHPPEVTININCNKKLKNVEVSEVIDLGDEENKDEVTVEESVDVTDDVTLFDS